jgi:multiple sugar transport system permease protein
MFKPGTRLPKLKIEFSNIIIFVLLAAFAIIMVMPILFMISTSFKPDDQIWAFPIVWIPKPPILDHYVKVWETIPVLRFFFNSVFVSGAVTVSQILISSMAAYAFARIRFFARDTIFMLFLGTMMIPAYVLIIPLYLIIDWLGLMDTYGALIAPSMVSAFSIFLLRQFFLSIPFDLDDSARIDGCNRMQILFKIILPLSKPALAALTIFVFMGAWNNFFWPLIVTSSQDIRVLPLGLAYFQVSQSTDWGPLMAAAVFATIPILIVFMFAQKRFIQGITMTGIKG